MLYFKECTLRINYLQGFRPSQPSLLPTWILVIGLDHTGLRFISQKIKKKNFSTLIADPQAIMLEHFLRFWTTILTAGALTLWHCKVSTLKCAVIIACIMLYFVISRGNYASGYTAFCFDLSPDHCLGDHFELTKQGNLRIELHFGQALANTVNLIIYAEFSALTLWHCKVSTLKCAVIIACIMPYFVVVILVWASLCIVFLKINALSKKIFR